MTGSLHHDKPEHEDSATRQAIFDMGKAEGLAEGERKGVIKGMNFRDHGHDPDGCDLIVCWEHGWPECPLEVIELRSVIDQL